MCGLAARFWLAEQSIDDMQRHACSIQEHYCPSFAAPFHNYECSVYVCRVRPIVPTFHHHIWHRFLQGIVRRRRHPPRSRALAASKWPGGASVRRRLAPCRSISAYIAGGRLRSAALVCVEAARSSEGSSKVPKGAKEAAFSICTLRHPSCPLA